MRLPTTQSALRSESNDAMPRRPVPEATAARLVALLPRSGGFDISSDDTSYTQAPRNLAPIIIYIIVGALIIASALLGH